jgi:hypothetical protein
MKKYATLFRTMMAIAAMAMAGLLVGCATPRLADVQSVADDDSAYLVFGALGQTDRQQEAAQRIISRAYDSASLLKPEAETGPLDAWIDYVDALEKPVTIATDRYKTAPELRQISDIQLVASYISNNPDALELDPTELSANWKESLEHARGIVETLTAAVTKSRNAATTAIKEKDLLAAYTAILAAYAIAPNDAAVKRQSVQIQDAIAADTLKSLEQQVKQITALQKNYGTDKNSAADVTAAEAALSRILDTANVIETSLTTHRIPLTDKTVREKIAKLRKEALAISGATLAEAIRLLAENKDYWGAYELTRSTLDRIKTDATLSRTDAAALATKAFEAMLPNGVRDLLEQANSAFYNDRFGVAFVASRMSRELYDYAGSIGSTAGAALTNQIQQADRTALDSENRIEVQIARKVLISDFVPAVTEDYENLGFQIRNRLRYLTSPTNTIAWGLEVPVVKSLAMETSANRNPLDLYYSGSMEKKISVDLLPPIELERGFFAVGTDRVHATPNAMHGLMDNVPRIIYSQEVHLYPWIKTMHRKQARIALRVVREIDKNAMKTVYEVDESYPNDRMQFTGLKVESEDLTYQPFILGTPKTANSREELVKDQPPVGRSLELTPDDEIKRAVINHMLDQIILAIEHDVAQFPAEALAAAALAHQSQGQFLDEADAWGHFLVYIQALLRADLAETSSWILKREAIRTAVVEWNKSRWIVQPDTVKSAVPEAWPNATAAYRKTL